MANIKEFSAYRYNSKKIEDIGSVMAPPYDTISDTEQNEYYQNHKNNIIRLSKGSVYENDTQEENCYTRAKKTLEDWIGEEVLIQDEKPCFYLYEQRVKYNETTFVNHGIVALVELSEAEDNEVVTCELPSFSATEDRYKLISAINANVDMINCMYIDPEKNLSSFITSLSDKTPDVEFSTEEKVLDSMTLHRIWLIKDDEGINFIKSSLKNKTLFITDGHNRYATALQYRNHCAQNDKNYTKESGCNYVMALLTNAFGNRMVQLPVHRMLNSSKKFNEEYFISCAQDNFKIEKIIVDTAIDKITDIMKKQISTMRMETKFALYCGGNYFYRLTLKDKNVVKNYLPDKSLAYCGLDVIVFNKLILEDILNISEDKVDDYVSYTKRATHGLESVKNKESGCMFVLNPVKAEQIREVALSGDVMPDRSIYIFPKPATGIIIHKFEN